MLLHGLSLQTVYTPAGVYYVCCASSLLPHGPPVSYSLTGRLSVFPSRVASLFLPHGPPLCYSLTGRFCVTPSRAASSLLLHNAPPLCLSVTPSRAASSLLPHRPPFCYSLTGRLSVTPSQAMSHYPGLITSDYHIQAGIIWRHPRLTHVSVLISLAEMPPP